MHSALDVPFESPHTNWAQPYAGGQIRVLFITGKNLQTMLGVTRYVVETRQRFDIEADVVMCLAKRLRSPTSATLLATCPWPHACPGRQHERRR